MGRLSLPVSCSKSLLTRGEFSIGLGMGCFALIIDTVERQEKCAGETIHREIPECEKSAYY